MLLCVEAFSYVSFFVVQIKSWLFLFFHQATNPLTMRAMVACCQTALPVAVGTPSTVSRAARVVMMLKLFA